jgi:aminoglycoside 3-N-acetyltransferase
MREANIIQNTTGPVTVDSLAADLLTLGVTPGQIILVHSSLSALGWVCGGPIAVILALEQTLGPQGTLVMPTHSGDLSDPAAWVNPPVPVEWWQVIRQTMPAYEPDMTPTQGMGAIPENFRKQPGVWRSTHPQVSFAAYGPLAQAITHPHPLPFGLGNQSPLARLYALNGWILLLGVSHNHNTSLHLAECRASYPGKKVLKTGAPVLIEGQRQWVEFDDIDWDDSDFELIGQDFTHQTGLVRQGRVAGATAQLMPQRPLVDFAVQWMEHNRQLGKAGEGFD